MTMSDEPYLRALTKPAYVLWPPGGRRWRVDGEYLARSQTFHHLRKAAPFGCHNEKRLPVRPSEHASEATAIKVHRLEHLAALAHAYASLVRTVGVPDGIFGVDADAVRSAITEVCPYTPIRQAPTWFLRFTV